MDVPTQYKTLPDGFLSDRFSVLVAELYAIILVMKELIKDFPPRKTLLYGASLPSYLHGASLITKRYLKNSRHPFAKLITQQCFWSSLTLKIFQTPSSESHHLTDQAATSQPCPTCTRYSTNHTLRNQSRRAQNVLSPRAQGKALNFYKSQIPGDSSEFF